MTKALLIIDVQTAIFDGFTPLEAYPQVIANIQSLTGRAREAGVPVIYVQHDGGVGTPFERGSPGWQLDGRLDVQLDGKPADHIVHKTAPDSFFQTDLLAHLQAHKVTELIICGCWTNYCVDTTSRRAVSLGFAVQLASDAHACSDSRVLKAAQIVAHHNDILQGLDAGAASIAVLPSAEVGFGEVQVNFG